MKNEAFLPALPESHLGLNKSQMLAVFYTVSCDHDNDDIICFHGTCLMLIFAKF